jgi:hypothetical protein
MKNRNSIDIISMFESNPRTVKFHDRFETRKNYFDTEKIAQIDGIIRLIKSPSFEDWQDVFNTEYGTLNTALGVDMYVLAMSTSVEVRLYWCGSFSRKPDGEIVYDFLVS